MFVLLSVYLSGMIGCATKESGAEKVSNDTQIVANMKEIVTIIGEVETQKKKAEEAAKQEVVQPVEKPTEKPVAATPKPGSKPSNKPSTSTTNKVSSKNVSAVDAFGVVLNVSISGTVDSESVGQYTITYTATDARGNTTTN